MSAGDRWPLTCLLLALLAVAGGVPLTGTASASASEIILVAHPSVPGDEIETADVERIYLGKRTRWSDDSTVVPVMLKSGNVHESFVESYLDRTPSRFVTYWRQAVFTGKGIPPKSFGNEADLREFVARTPGAVGYVSRLDDATGLKVLRVR